MGKQKKSSEEEEKENQNNPGILGRIWERVSKVRNSKIVKIATSSAVSRGISIAFAATGITLGALSLSGVSIGAAAGFILAPQIAIPLAVASLGVVAIGVAIDTYMVRKTRQLHSENKHLSRHCIAKDVQDKILEQNPELSKALENELYTPEREGKKSVSKRYIENKNSTKKSLASNIFLNSLKVISAGAVSLIEGIVSRNPVKVVKVVASSTIGLGSSISGSMSMSAKRNEFRENIDSLRDRSDSPGYDNLKELKIAARKQKIQTLALKELVEDPDYKNYSNEQIKEKFKIIIEKIEKTEKAIQSEYRLINIVKNFVIAHNPFSKYNDPTKLTTKVEVNEFSPKKQSKKQIISEKIKQAARRIHIKRNLNSKRKSNIQSKEKTSNSRGRY